MHHMDTVYFVGIDVSPFQAAQLFQPRPVIDAKQRKPPILVLDDDITWLMSPITLLCMRLEACPDGRVYQTRDRVLIPKQPILLAWHVLAPFKTSEHATHVDFRDIILDVHPLEVLLDIAPMAVERALRHSQRSSGA